MFISDLTGSADGSVRLWEWEHSQPLTVLRAPGNFPKVTKVLFNAQGNKVKLRESLTLVMLNIFMYCTPPQFLSRYSATFQL